MKDLNLLKLKHKERRIGYELEFTHLDLNFVAELVIKHFGGQVKKHDAFVLDVVDTEVGDFRLECDSSFLKDGVYRDWLANIGIELSPMSSEALDKILSEKSDILVPRELVTPPIKLQDLGKMESLVEDMKAKFNEFSPTLTLAPCGLHLNIECIDLETDTLLNTLRGFCQLYKEIKKEANIDWTRQLAPYIKGFPDDYVDLILDPTYIPTEKQFVKDYFSYNPTRNRALDLTVIFSHLDKNYLEGVEGLETQLIKARPAFHYRLPNCELHNKDWNLSLELDRWFKIEKKGLGWMQDGDSHSKKDARNLESAAEVTS